MKSLLSPGWNKVHSVLPRNSPQTRSHKFETLKYHEETLRVIGTRWKEKQRTGKGNQSRGLEQQCDGSREVPAAINLLHRPSPDLTANKRYQVQLRNLVARW